MEQALALRRWITWGWRLIVLLIRDMFIGSKLGIPEEVLSMA